MSSKSKINKSSYLNKLENINLNTINSNWQNDVSCNTELLPSSLDLSCLNDVSCFKYVLSKIAVVTEDDLRAFWSMMMASDEVAEKDKLTASKLLAQSYGMLDTKNKAVASVGGAIYKWKTAVDAEVVHEEKTVKASEDVSVN